jgi:hypothetical protein
MFQLPLQSSPSRSFTQLAGCVILRWGTLVSCNRSKARYAMILLMLVCSLANADSITNLLDKSTPLSENRGVPVLQDVARLTGLNPLLNPSLWIDPRPRATPVRLLLLVEQPPPLHTSSVADQAIDFVLALYQRLMGHPIHKTKINGNHY